MPISNAHIHLHEAAQQLSSSPYMKLHPLVAVCDLCTVALYSASLSLCINYHDIDTRARKYKRKLPIGVPI